jgi:hypothetical protein
MSMQHAHAILLDFFFWPSIDNFLGLKTFQPPGPGTDTCSILTFNPADCGNKVKTYRSEQNIYVILAKNSVHLKYLKCVYESK